MAHVTTEEKGYLYGLCKKQPPGVWTVVSSTVWATGWHPSFFLATSCPSLHSSPMEASRVPLLYQDGSPVLHSYRTLYLTSNTKSPMFLLHMCIVLPLRLEWCCVSLPILVTVQCQAEQTSVRARAHVSTHTHTQNQASRFHFLVASFVL